MVDDGNSSRQPHNSISKLIKLTGVVVVYNEELRLGQCLNNLRFCEHLLVVDLGSKDQSIEIAKRFGAEIIQHQWVPIVELVRGNIINNVKTDWVVFLDPDMMFPLHLADDISDIIYQNPDLGCIDIPYVNYFRGKKLEFSRWMRPGIFPTVLHKDRVEFSSYVHAGMKLRSGYARYRIQLGFGNNYIQHYWGESYKHIYQKHVRYLKQEGKSMFNRGIRFSYQEFFKEVYRELKDGVLKYRGLSGGLHAWILTLFWLWYVVMRWLSLLKYQKS